jgi:hypothetical protein
MGLRHQRLENRHGGGPDGTPDTITARGHVASMAATIAATSSSVGAGLMLARST